MTKEVSEYINILTRGRSLITRQMSDRLQREILILYAGEMNRATDMLHSGEIDAGNYRNWVGEVRRSFDRLFGEVETLSKREILATIRRNGELHAFALERLQSQTGFTASYSFEGIADEAIRGHFFRRELGAARTYETLKSRGAVRLANSFERKIVQGLARGDSWRNIRGDLTKTLLLEHGSPVELTDEMRKKRVLSLRDFGNVDDETRAEIKRLLSDMNRIAITEINNANTEADRAGAERSPVVKGMKWSVSSRHEGLPSSPDICDIYAEADDHDMGEGVYFAETLPARPHPYCGCVITYVLREPEEWDEPKPEPTEPKQLTNDEIGGIFEKVGGNREVTEALINATRERYNAYTGVAHAVWDAA
jgi:hypothetical protein